MSGWSTNPNSTNGPGSVVAMLIAVRSAAWLLCEP